MGYLRVKSMTKTKIEQENDLIQEIIDTKWSILGILNLIKTTMFLEDEWKESYEIRKGYGVLYVTVTVRYLIDGVRGSVIEIIKKEMQGRYPEYEYESCELISEHAEISTYQLTFRERNRYE